MMHNRPNAKLPDQAPPGKEQHPPGHTPHGKKQKKTNWKSLLATAVALLILWQVVHVISQSQSHHAGKAPVTAPKPKPTPTPTVTIGGRRISAGGGPVIILNPGLVNPGGHVEVIGSGFPARTPVTVAMRTARSGKGTVVTHSRVTRDGMVIAGFTIPTGLTAPKATVIVTEPDGTQATADLATPGGMGTATIAGKAAGHPGNTATVSATGFGPGERVNVYWGRVSGPPAATLTADPTGSIHLAAVPVGIAPTGPTTMVLVGQKTHTTATAPYLMLGLYPNTASHPYAVKAGHSINFTGSGFAPNEPVVVYLNASHGTPALTPTADGTGHFAVSFVVPFGLRGAQRLTAMGTQSRATVSSGFTVLPYLPAAQASTYGAMPGTMLTFYANGFAANEVVLVYLGGGPGRGGQLVSAFRVDAKGSASSAGQYLVPSGAGNALYFSMVGQESHGVAKASVKVSAPPGQVTVPPQKPYVLPPSLGGKPTPGPSHSPSANHPANHAHR